MKATGRNVKQAAKVLRRFEQFMRLWADRSRRGDGFSKKKYPEGEGNASYPQRLQQRQSSLHARIERLAAARLQGVYTWQGTRRI
jgi:hypothetical protein